MERKKNKKSTSFSGEQLVQEFLGKNARIEKAVVETTSNLEQFLEQTIEESNNTRRVQVEDTFKKTSQKVDDKIQKDLLKLCHSSSCSKYHRKHSDILTCNWVNSWN